VPRPRPRQADGQAVGLHRHAGLHGIGCVRLCGGSGASTLPSYTPPPTHTRTHTNTRTCTGAANLASVVPLASPCISSGSASGVKAPAQGQARVKSPAQAAAQGPRAIRRQHVPAFQAAAHPPARRAPPLALPPLRPAGVVDVCLIPEVPFRIDKLCAFVAKVIERKGHCVVCCAEGAGQVRVCWGGGEGGDGRQPRWRASKCG
jgi:hypothetical protein